MSVLSKTNRGRARMRDARPGPKAQLPTTSHRPRRARSTANGLESAEPLGSKPHDDEQFRAIDHILEILREGGYRCELLDAKPGEPH
jgi:hypothetical protein